MNYKYYTPTLSEIYSHPRLVLADDNRAGDVIINPYAYLDENRLSINLSDLIDINKYVIKYLDKDDIINLGFFHFYDDFTFGVFNLHKDELLKYQIDYDYESNFMEIGIFTNDGLEKKQDIFAGKIKNKHELRTLLIQLEIINE